MRYDLLLFGIIVQLSMLLLYHLVMDSRLDSFEKREQDRFYQMTNQIIQIDSRFTKLDQTDQKIVNGIKNYIESQNSASSPLPE